MQYMSREFLRAAAVCGIAIYRSASAGGNE
jgi:hypothetical protein